MQTLSHKQKNANYQLKIATFPLLIVRIPPPKKKINRVQAIDDIDKLCKFHENLKFAIGRVESIVGKAETAACQQYIFSFSHNVFNSSPSLRDLKVRIILNGTGL